uniref:protein-glutamine gamma-glutamyltransferase K n=1 Tax=Ciona intestinalis TaxID=7719 RepID=UPI000180CBAA|nr:protein-glutamine gamma-glutamyltransferase K [Ciona intestinalis]|eukprot:XP_002119887.1 protein-glutamine gamma-glutamyltransferase K [Ciona intestinalis]
MARGRRGRPRGTGRGRSPSKDALAVKSVDLLKSDNTVQHYTSDYEGSELVVRRGQPFKLLITLSRALKKEEEVEFELRMGGRPMVAHGSLIPLKVIDPKPDEDVVGFKLLANAGDILTVEIYTSAENTGVGKWLLALRAMEGRKKLPRMTVTDDIIIVFNPWSKFDPVYMENEAWRDEYVLNEEGLQFYGTSRRHGKMEWVFGQFEAHCMKAAMKLLLMGSLRYKDHKEPVMVARHMSALVNSNDDNGVLVGNWSGDYSGGRSPSFWHGSTAILKQFVKTGKPVNYGQCWVFSGVLTSVLRCLGIPTRSLTTFDSAHDTGGNLTIDKHYNETGKPLENDDSIWNFHVWNDVWMARPMLPEGNGGWQALDATPQETSDGKFQCGPMPVSAIKEGDINFDYDGPFIYAEVNAVEKHWRKLKKPQVVDGKMIEYSEIGANTTKVGKLILTKAVNSWAEEDITHSYKYPEGTKEEALSFKNARKHVKFTYVPKKEVKNLVLFKPDVPASVTFGKDITFPIKVENVSKSSQNVFISVVAKSVQYNGSIVKEILDVDLSDDIAAGKTHTFNVSLPFNTYKDSTRGENDVKFFMLGGVTGNEDQVFSEQDLVDLEKPDITVKVPASAQVGKQINVKASFTNPLSISLTGCMFTFEGAGIRDETIVEVSDVKPKAVSSVDVKITPRVVGTRKVIVGFSSKQLEGLRGNAELKVA